MKITVKTTQQKVFQIEVESGETVADLKAKIHESQGHPVAGQKIIYSGKILTDDKTIDSCGIKEKDFLVLMVSKPKLTPTPAPSATSGIASESTVPEVVPSQTEPTTIPAATSPEVTQEMTTLPRSTSDSGSSSHGDLLSGHNLQDAINNIVEMGFPKDQVMRAMRASFNNADRAVEYLMAGLPTHTEDVPSPSLTTNQPQNLFQLAQQQQQAGVSGPGPQPNLEALRDNSQIQQLREQIVQNPALLQYLIQQLGSHNPSIAQMLADNPEALLQQLGIEHDVAESDGNSIPPGAQVVSVTEEERAAIQRLEALGFSRQDAAVAYFACDKNEELAANYLFERLDDDHSDQ